MKAVVLACIGATACMTVNARVDVEDYESRIERFTPATLPADSGPVDYVAIKTRGAANAIDRYDARVRRVGDMAVIERGETVVRVPLADVVDVEVYRGRAVLDHTSASSTDALSIGLVLAVVVGFLAIIPLAGTRGIE